MRNTPSSRTHASSTPTVGDPLVVRVAFALLAAELGLARVTGGPQSALHVAIDVLLVAGAAGLLHLSTRPSWAGRARVHGALAAVLSSGVAFVLVATALHTWHHPHALGAAAGAALGCAVLCLAGGRWLGPRSVPGLAVGALFLSTGLIWLTLDAGLPPVSLWLGVAAWLGASAWLASHRGWPLLPLLAGALAWFPLTPFSTPGIPWRAGAGAATGPDIVLIVADTLRADAAAKMGFVRTLAGQGMDVGPAQSAAPWTLPAMASMMTSLPVEEHGAIRTLQGTHRAIRREARTLAEILSEAGYDTAAVLAENGNVGPKLGFARGFDYYDFDGSETQRFALPVSRSGPARPLLVQLLFGAFLFVDAPELKRWTDYGSRNDAQVLVERTRWVLRLRRERPLFLWVHFMDAHLPYHHAAELDEIPRWLRGRLTDTSGDPFREDPAWQTEGVRSAARRGYAHEVEHLDRALQALVRELGPPPPRGRVLVFTADHGEEFFEHGGFEHGQGFYQELLGVPLVIAGTPIAPLVHPASSLDVAPTLLAAAGVPIPAAMRGHDLRTAPELRNIRSRNLERPPRSAETEAAFAVRRGRWKMIEQSGLELFDLDLDPGEQRDLSGSEPALLDTLRGSGSQPIQVSDTVQFDPAEIQRLKALGYTGD